MTICKAAVQQKTGTEDKLIKGGCSICKINKTKTVQDNTTEVEGLGTFLKNLQGRSCSSSRVLKFLHTKTKTLCVCFVDKPYFFLLMDLHHLKMFLETQKRSMENTFFLIINLKNI